MSPLQRAARFRAYRIRSLRNIRTSLFEDPTDRFLVEQMIDKQLRSMGAETIVERRARWSQENDAILAGKSFNLRVYEETGSPYTITEDDILRYTSY